MNSHTTNAYPITKEVYNYLLPVYERGRFVEKAGKYWFFSAIIGTIKIWKGGAYTYDTAINYRRT